jgi:hypothetical protein
MCRDGRFSLPPPDDDANGSKAGRRDDPTRDADDDAKTYESIECPACSRVHLVNPARAEPIGRKLRITDRMLDVLYAPSKPGFTGKSAFGFTVVLTPLSGTLAAGSFDVSVHA